ncbi:MAG: DUF1501 domain-containing protein [Planctomyces sp.]|jgi:hypothetical protein|nr:DUF1501 domain-containing protein [Planctomyces sp.]HAV34645.1 DUF1501 domain-containing protein [Planctomycetaceae bacterium]HBC63295.1 DUF1501 domain-containing protein [Planctomycetaceae bacterium]
MKRRVFLSAAAAGCSALAGGERRVFAQTSPLAAGRSARTAPGTARSTILFFLSGGASHIDMWDMKPAAPLEYRGPFQPISTSAPGVTLCQHLPLLAQQAHHLALLNSIGGSVSTNDHHAGYYYNLTGHVPDSTFLSLGNNRTPYASDWPSMATVAGSRRPPHPDLTNAITIPHVEGAPAYTRPGQFAARLGTQYDPLFVIGSREKPTSFQAPAITLEGGITPDRLADRTSMLQALDDARRDLDRSAAVESWSAQQQRAFSLLMSRRTTAAFDVSQEPAEVLDRYGRTINGTSLLLARRLAEAGVPFITVFWMGDEKQAERRKCASGGGWDTHGNNFQCLQDWLLPEFDRGFSALVEDLSNRGLLDQTLLLITSEMGRKPKIGDPRSGGPSGAGRDHWTHCLTNVMAGGGVQGGQTYGSSDRFAEYPQDRPLTPADVARTVYHAMGITDLTAYDTQNRPYQLLDTGEPLTELF